MAMICNGKADLLQPLGAHPLTVFPVEGMALKVRLHCRLDQGGDQAIFNFNKLKMLSCDNLYNSAFLRLL